VNSEQSYPFFPLRKTRAMSYTTFLVPGFTKLLCWKSLHKLEVEEQEMALWVMKTGQCGNPAW
jgi:hypothetical protein